MKTITRIVFSVVVLFAFTSLCFSQTYSPTYTTKVEFKCGPNKLLISPSLLSGVDTLFLPATVGENGDVLRIIDDNGGTDWTPSGVLSGGPTEDIQADDQAVTVGNRSYITVTQDDGAGASSRTIALSNGTHTGQLLVIECASVDEIEIDESATVNLSSTHALGQNDTVTLLWNGSRWIETSYSDN